MIYLKKQVKILEIGSDNMNNKILYNPLTVEKLKKMDGKPVLYNNECFIVYLDYQCYGDVIINRYDSFFSLEEAVKEGVYLYPPAHIDLEAWKGCQLCHESNYIAGRAVATTEFMRGEFVSGVSGEFSFCPCCGKPLNKRALTDMNKRFVSIDHICR